MSHDKPQPDISELPDYARWHSEDGISLMDYASIKLTPDLAIAVTKLFWPDFILYEDCVFLADRFNTKVFTDWQEHLQGDLERIERVMNHQHLAQDTFRYPFENFSYHNIAYFGDVLAKCWRSALRDQYPERDFVVSTEKDGEFDDVIITFYQKR